MRTISAAQDAVLALPYAMRAERLKVEVDSTGSGDFINLSNYWNRDWIVSVDYSETVDNPLATVTMVVVRAFEEINLSPWATNSPANQGSILLYMNRAIKIYMAVTAADSAAASTDWQLIFEGTIDTVDPGGKGNTIKVIARDNGGKLQDAFIQDIDKRPYPAATDSSEDVIQAIINGDVASPPTLYVPAGSGWDIKTYYQQKEPVLDAIKKIADQIGWSLRYRWDNGTGQFRLTYYQPDRTASSAVRTFGPHQYSAINEAPITVKNIRNKIRVYYYADPEGNPLSVTVEDATSISEYDTRYMEVTNRATSQIDSSGEATTLANAILADLKDPSMTHTVEMPLFWPVTLGDYYKFEANKTIYHSDQDLAVCGIKHRFASGRATTTLMCRGKPVSRTTSWLALEGRPGFAPPVDNKADDAATGLTVDRGAGGAVILTYDDPASMSPPILDWATTKLYISTTSGFTPSSGNLAAQNKATRFVVENLVSGTTYYIKIQIIDSQGNVSATSTQQSIVAGFTGALHLSRNDERGNIMTNAAFSDWSSPHTLANNPPDNWEPAYTTSGISDTTPLTGYWRDGHGNDGVYYDTTTVKTAGYSAKLYADIDSSLITLGIRTADAVPCSGDTVYKAEMIAWTRYVTNGVRCELFVYDSSMSLLERVAMPAGLLGPNSWTHWFIHFRTNSNAKWIRAFPHIKPYGNTSVNTESLAYVDRVILQRSQSSFRAEGDPSTATSIPASTWTKVEFRNEIYDYGNEYDDTASTGSIMTAKDEGLYSFESMVGLDGLGNGKSMQIALYVDFGGGSAAYVKSVIAENNSGSARDTYATITTREMQLYPGNTVKVMVWHNDTGALNTLTSEDCQFAGDRLV